MCEPCLDPDCNKPTVKTNYETQGDLNRSDI